MASIAIMIGGAVLNATTFIGGSHLAKYLGGDKTDTEHIRHDKALEKYKKDYQKYMESQRAFEQWKEAQAQRSGISRQDFANTDEALKLYNQTHSPLPPNEPKFSDYYKPSSSQKFG